MPFQRQTRSVSMTMTSLLSCKIFFVLLINLIILHSYRTVAKDAKLYSHLKVIKGFEQNDSFNCGVHVLVVAYALSLSQTWNNHTSMNDVTKTTQYLYSARRSFWIISALIKGFDSESKS